MWMKENTSVWLGKLILSPSGLVLWWISGLQRNWKKASDLRKVWERIFTSLASQSIVCGAALTSPPLVWNIDSRLLDILNQNLNVNKNTLQFMRTSMPLKWHCKSRFLNLGCTLYSPGDILKLKYPCHTLEKFIRISVGGGGWREVRPRLPVYFFNFSDGSSLQTSLRTTGLNTGNVNVVGDAWMRVPIKGINLPYTFQVQETIHHFALF